jgi:hypothetical protein
MSKEKDSEGLKQEVQILSLQQEIQRLKQTINEIQADKETHQSRLENLENSFLRVTIPEITSKIADTVTVENAVMISGSVLQTTKSLINAVGTTATPLLQSLKEAVKEGLRNPKRPKKPKPPAVRLYKHGSRATSQYL